METNQLIDMLTQERAKLLARAEKLDQAIAALSGDEPAPSPKPARKKQGKAAKKTGNPAAKSNGKRQEGAGLAAIELIKNTTGQSLSTSQLIAELKGRFPSLTADKLNATLWWHQNQHRTVSRREKIGDRNFVWVARAAA